MFHQEQGTHVYDHVCQSQISPIITIHSPPTGYSFLQCVFFTNGHDFYHEWL